MAKQETVRYDKYGLFIDGIQAERITSVSVSGDFGTEDILQLADSGIVQKVSQSPEVSLTVEANFIGSTDNLRLMTDRILNYATANSTNDPRKQYIKGWQTFDRIAAGSANAAYIDVDHLDMLDSYVDITIPIGDGTTSIGRTAHFHRFGLTGYSISLDVAGNATESFTLNGANRYWYASVHKAVRCHVLSDGEIASPVSSASGGLHQTFYLIPSAVPIGASVMGFFYGRNTAFANNITDWSFIKSGTPLGDDGTRDDVNKWDINNIARTDPNTNWAVPFVSSPTDASREKAYILWYHEDSSQTYGGNSTSDWGIEITHTSGTLGAVARQYAEVYLWNSAGGTAERDKLLRLQSFNIDVSPESENKYQIGEKEAYSIFRKTPVNVTGSFSVLASDIEPTSILSGTGGAINQLTTDSFNAHNQMRVKFYRDEARITVLSSVIIRNFTVSNESYSISVGGEGAEEFSFEADNFRFLGTGENPNQ